MKIKNKVTRKGKLTKTICNLIYYNPSPQSRDVERDTDTGVLRLYWLIKIVKTINCSFFGQIKVQHICVKFPYQS